METEPDTGILQQGKQSLIMECYIKRNQARCRNVSSVKQILECHNKENRARYCDTTTRETDPDKRMSQQRKQSQKLDVKYKETEPDTGKTQQRKAETECHIK